VPTFPLSAAKAGVQNATTTSVIHVMKEAPPQQKCGPHASAREKLRNGDARAAFARSVPPARPSSISADSGHD